MKPEKYNFIVQGKNIGETLEGISKEHKFKYFYSMKSFLKQKLGESFDGADDSILSDYHLIGIPADINMFEVIAQIYREGARNEESSVNIVEPSGVFETNSNITPVVGSEFRLSRRHKCNKLRLGADLACTHLSDLECLDKLTFSCEAPVKISIVDSGINEKYNIYPDKVFSVSETAIDDTGHGTAMAEIIRDVCKAADLHVIKVTEGGRAYLWEVMAGLAVAYFKVNSTIVNLSLGLKEVDFKCTVCGAFKPNIRSVVLGNFVSALNQAHPNTVLVAAVGNEGNEKPFDWPARYEDVLAIGSWSAKKRLSSFSNASQNDPKQYYALAPGGDEKKGNGTRSEWIGQWTGKVGKITYLIGTSPATAYASGILGLYVQYIRSGHCFEKIPTSEPSDGKNPVVSRQDLLEISLKGCQKDKKVMKRYNRSKHGQGLLVFEPGCRSRSRWRDRENGRQHASQVSRRWRAGDKRRRYKLV